MSATKCQILSQTPLGWSWRGRASRSAVSKALRISMKNPYVRRAVSFASGEDGADIEQGLNCPFTWLIGVLRVVDDHRTAGHKHQNQPNSRANPQGEEAWPWPSERRGRRDMHKELSQPERHHGCGIDVCGWVPVPGIEITDGGAFQYGNKMSTAAFIYALDVPCWGADCLPIEGQATTQTMPSTDTVDVVTSGTRKATCSCC